MLFGLLIGENICCGDIDIWLVFPMALFGTLAISDVEFLAKIACGETLVDSFSFVGLASKKFM